MCVYGKYLSTFVYPPVKLDHLSGVGASTKRKKTEILILPLTNHAKENSAFYHLIVCVYYVKIP